MKNRRTPPARPAKAKPASAPANTQSAPTALKAGSRAAEPRSSAHLNAAIAATAVGKGQGRTVFAALFSLAFHALLLSITFVFPEPVRHDSPESRMKVVMVNAHHKTPAQDATLLAQANLDGGGKSDNDLRPTTPVAPTRQQEPGNALIDAQKRAEAKPVPKTAVLTQPSDQHKRDIRPTPPPSEPVEEKNTPTGVDLIDSVSVASKIQAQIDKKLEAYAKRPRKHFIGARAREYRFASYVDDWRQKIERIGTLNYPEKARGRLSGRLVMSVSIRADGSLDSVKISKSSGHPILDEAAKRIVKMSAPFAKFPPNIRDDTDILQITRTWKFTSSNQLQSE